MTRLKYHNVRTKNKQNHLCVVHNFHKCTKVQFYVFHSELQFDFLLLLSNIAVKRQNLNEEILYGFCYDLHLNYWKEVFGISQKRDISTTELAWSTFSYKDS